jgi:hypothetical protein
MDAILGYLKSLEKGGTNSTSPDTGTNINFK